MGDEGAKALAHHLATLTSLQLIDISQAKIDLGTKIKCVRLRKLPFEVAQPARSPCASCSHMTAWKRTRLGPTAFIAGDMSSGCTSPACNMDQYAAPGLSARGGARPPCVPGRQRGLVLAARPARRGTTCERGWGRVHESTMPILEGSVGHKGGHEGQARSGAHGRMYVGASVNPCSHARAEVDPPAVRQNWKKGVHRFGVQ